MGVTAQCSRQNLPQLIDGYKRNEAFAGIKPFQCRTAKGGHRRNKTLGFNQEILLEEEDETNYARVTKRKELEQDLHFKKEMNETI